MCKIKRLFGVSCLLPAIFLLSACSAASASFGDAGAQIAPAHDREEYLDVALAESTETDAADYKTAVLSFGTFSVPAREATYDRGFYTMTPIRAKVLSGTTMTYAQNLASPYRFVKKGAEIARVETKVDPVDIQEAELKLTRLKERCERAKGESLAQRSEDAANISAIADPYERRAAQILLERSELEWQHTLKDYERQIEDATERLTALTDAAKMTVITSDADGNIVFPATPYKNGDTIEDGDVICNLIDPDDFCFVANNANLSYRYGMTFQFHVAAGASKTEDIQGRLVSGTSADLYGNLDRDEVYFKVDLPEGTETRRIANGRIQGDLITMEHVLLVPADAVFIQDDQTYVTVQREDGTFIKTEFVAGGSNSSYYWPLRGLDEGMKVVLQP